MKRLLSIFLCLIMLCAAVACSKKNDQTQNEDMPEQTSQSNAQEQQSQDGEQNSEQNSEDIHTSMLFGDYQDILDTISLLHSQGDSFDASKYSDLDEREDAIYNSLSHFICGGIGYCIKDINNDGVDELIMLTEMWELRGLFTMNGDLPVLLEKCDNGGIGNDGKIRAEYIEESEEYVKTVYSLKSLVDGALLTELELEEIDYVDDDSSDQYYQITEGERVEKALYEFTDLKISYSFKDYHILTPSADIVCTRLLDIPTVIERGEYYSESVLKDENGSYIYYLNVYDKNGNLVSLYQGKYVGAYEFKNDEQETIVKIYQEDEKIIYYNVLEGVFSEEFGSDKILTERGRVLVCISEQSGEKHLVVRDIFDPTKLYLAYDHEAVKSGAPSVDFSQDGKSITLKYRSEGAKNDTTRVLCLENLSVLKTQKICYVRYEPSINSDCVMVSSGIRAVLRADTSDTIRCLDSLSGGEYTSDDGTVRNDWYCIDYRGEICYVTADSFEVAYQFDIPTDDKVPYTFISKQERAAWKDKIVNVISKNNLYEDYEMLQYNFLGMALMDLNFDNTPEVIAAYAGGSMGNVCIIAYDLNTGEKLCMLGDTSHYQGYDDVYFCLYRNSEGKFIIVNEGAMRVELNWYTITSLLNDQFKFETLFKKVESSDDNTKYYCYGNEVDKSEFEQQKNQFKNDYKEIKDTQLQIIYWNTIDAQSRNEAISDIADALINSEQEFINFNN